MIAKTLGCTIDSPQLVLTPYAANADRLNHECHIKAKSCGGELSESKPYGRIAICSAYIAKHTTNDTAAKPGLQSPFTYGWARNVNARYRDETETRRL